VKAVLFWTSGPTPNNGWRLEGFARGVGGPPAERTSCGSRSRPISFTVLDGNVHTAQVTLKAGALAQVETRALTGADAICHNEETFYPPLAKLDHAMPAYTLANRFQGLGLGDGVEQPGRA